MLPVNLLSPFNSSVPLPAFVSPAMPPSRLELMVSAPVPFVVTIKLLTQPKPEVLMLAFTPVSTTIPPAPMGRLLVPLSAGIVPPAENSTALGVAVTTLSTLTVCATIASEPVVGTTPPDHVAPLIQSPSACVTNMPPLPAVTVNPLAMPSVPGMGLGS